MMISKNFVTTTMWLYLLLAGSFLIGLAESQSQSQSQSLYTCNYSDELSIHNDGTTFMQQYINQEEGTFTMRIRYTGGNSWIGIGINTKGKGDMVPAYAVIGDINRGVKRYNLQSDDKKGSGVIPLEDTNGHLKSGESSFVQTTEATGDGDGESILEFTHDLVIRDPSNGSIIHEISESSTWIWAVGLPNNVWEGKHKVHGAFNGFELFNGCVIKQTAVATKAPTAPPTKKTTEGTEDKIPDNYPIYPEDYVETTNESETIGVATGEENVVDTKPETGHSSDDSDDEKDTTYNVGQSISFIDSSDSEATRSLWVAHGFLMGVAWGIFAPLAIGAAYLRNTWSFLNHNARWLQIHFCFSAIVALLTIVGFAVAVVATKKDDDLPHFEEDTHHKAGLAIFILVLIQGFAGYFRPSPVPKKLASQDDDGDQLLQDSASHSTSSAVSTPASTPTKYSIDSQTFDDVEESNDSSSPDSTVNPSLKTETIVKISSNQQPSPSVTKVLYIRRFWEYTHRSLGIILLSLAWYNCHSGIILQSENYDQDDEESLLAIFWGITGCIAGTIFFVGYVLRA